MRCLRRAPRFLLLGMAHGLRVLELDAVKSFSVALLCLDHSRKELLSPGAVCSSPTRTLERAVWTIRLERLAILFLASLRRTRVPLALWPRPAVLPRLSQLGLLLPSIPIVVSPALEAVSPLGERRRLEGTRQWVMCGKLDPSSRAFAMRL